MRDLLLGVRFVQADGVVTWGGAKVVKSVTGYDVPKLLVGSLGTLGVLAELTLRLHPLPGVEAHVARAAAARAAAAQDARRAPSLDSTLQPNRLELLDAARAARRAALPRPPPALLVSIGERRAEAVREQGERCRGWRAARGRRVDARWRGVLDGVRRDARRDARDRAARDRRSLPAPPGGDARGADARRGAVPASPASRSAGSAALGVLRVASTARRRTRIGRGALERLRAAWPATAAASSSSAAPRELRARVDPWGPVAADGARAHAARSSASSIPSGVLNPGRFVGGL